MSTPSSKNLSRRSFITGAALAGTTAALAGLNGCAPAASGGSDAASGEAVSTTSHAWLNPAPELPETVAEETYDVVVIGAGIAGCTAAQAAAEAGASVYVAEKFEGVTAHGTDIGAVGSKLQQAEGVNIDKDLAARLIYQWGQSEANYYLIKTFVERSGEAMDHYIDMAVEAGYEVILNSEMTARSDWDTLDDRFKQFRTAHKFLLPEGSSLPEQPWNVGYFISMVAEDAQKRGAVFAFETAAEQLVREGDAVTAVIVRDAEGAKRINASKGVILATGGITDNEEMKRCFCPIALRADKSDYFPVGGQHGRRHNHGLVDRRGALSLLSGAHHPPGEPVGHGSGLRHVLAYREPRRHALLLRSGIRAHRHQRPHEHARQRRVAIWDSHYPEHAQRQEPVKSASFMDGLEDKVEQAVADGAFFKSETLSELAEAIGVPADALQKTVDRYNSLCDAGEDRDFGVPPRFLSSVKDGPFYASNVSAWLLALPYGLRVDQNSQVLDTEDGPIGGLFAIGNAQGRLLRELLPSHPARHEPRPRHDLRLPGGPRAGGRHDHRRIRVRRSAVAPWIGSGSGAH